MAWYYLRTSWGRGVDRYGEVAYIELDRSGIAEDDIRDIVSEAHPGFDVAKYVEGFSELEEFEVDSREFESEDAFLAAFGAVVGTASNNAYSLRFGPVSTKEARRQA